MRRYLTVLEIASLHRILIDQYGGTAGIRDPGALESACFRPQCGYYENIIEEAAALMESLAINHPFLDGNKRVSFASVDVFLRLNKYRIIADSDELYKKTMQLFSEKKFEFVELNKLLKKYAVYFP
ncbi:MAG: type II toxin-antitoxin system death-on-curing family toxin [Alphaproteobacteria bacterium]|jgi:death on curing protein|nr:type II toxin-antitoxin system death-on-curing family toxin [Alphaproteobacteria bacterium]MBT5390151.1 type II toxin-antitoxin system death-on-curing family toxin [Alphaproteobacteria bacterium]MBT5540428.1 type II toxin-antitoxin system death-on-curing family toxin [Alphaproteobacteria bacterium]MBT5654945.1 type II toxin-antitoxin system death-on-curing family toxin [Alphaproteobacteria bacterium]